MTSVAQNRLLSSHSVQETEINEYFRHKSGKYLVVVRDFVISK